MNRRAACCALAFFVWSLGFGPGCIRAAEGAEPDRAEAALRRRAATALLEFAEWCVKNNARSPGQLAATQAGKIDVDTPRLPDAIALLEKALNTAAPATVEPRRAQAFEAAARDLETLAERVRAAGDRPGYVKWLCMAVELSPKRAQSVPELVDRALQAGDLDSAEKLFAAVLSADPAAWDAVALGPARAALAEGKQLSAAVTAAVGDLCARKRQDMAAALIQRIAKTDAQMLKDGKLQPAEAALAKDIFLLGSRTHALVGYVSLPKGWTAGKQWPIIVAFAGAGRDYETTAAGLAGARGEAPYIVLTPVTFSNSNSVNDETHGAWYPTGVIRPLQCESMSAAILARQIEFELDGVFALLATVQRYFNGEQKIFVTGVSGGGHPCYASMLANPGMIAAAAPACANYHPVRVASKGGSGGPVLQLLGADDEFNQKIKDEPGLIPQSDAAMRELKAHGFRDVRREIVQGVAHNPMYSKVIAFFESVRKGQ